MIRVEDAGIKLLGASLGIVPCRARFVGRFVAFSTFVSTTSGLFFGQAGALLGVGPLVPYLVGACVEFQSKFYGAFDIRAASSRRPPRNRRDTCSMAWRCRFLTARRSQHARVVAEK